MNKLHTRSDAHIDIHACAHTHAVSHPASPCHDVPHVEAKYRELHENTQKFEPKWTQ